eukprot:TRINITY_DN13272_c0_g1_i1.p1 TRINITY_DN13272_c0_g1~~TRINITY_DN13272_c0_g1_i1.p1  ORF type:complete len:242 (-),score=24.31 TRINITY_DN13272_c0_g1_i1:49-774(-)
MTLSTLIGCAFIAFSPLLSILIFVILPKPYLVVFSIGSAFFWLLSILLSSTIWWIVVPLREIDILTIIQSVIIQELVRAGFYYLYSKTLNSKIMGRSDKSRTDQKKLILLDILAIGVGYSLASSSIMYGGILWDSRGNGTFYINSCMVSIFLNSAILSLINSILNISWTFILFDGLKNLNYIKIIFVVITHLITSGSTVLNTLDVEYICIAPIAINLVILMLSLAFNFYIFKTNITFSKNY